MQTSSLRRQVKNVVNNYTEAEIKVREATSNDPWGASSTLMAEIADLTYNMVAFTEVMGIIWRRLNDHGKNWRHVYKALTLLDYLIKAGSVRVGQECRDNIYSIQTLKDFQYVDRDGEDQGIHIREKAKKLVALLKDPEKLKKDRAQASKTRSRMVKLYGEYGELPPPYPATHAAHYETSESRSSPSSLQSSFSLPRLAPDLEQARPTTTGEEELQLQLALAMSREESEKSFKRPPTTLEIDEDSQLKLAMSMSKEAHQQEQLGRQGDDSMLKKALEESKREMASKGGTAFMDLVDVFAAPKEPPPKEKVWPRSAGVTEPSDESGGSPRVADAAWRIMPASASPPPPWEPSPPSGNPWDPPVAANPWASGSLAADPFTTAKKSLRAVSPSDDDLFDVAMDGGMANGRRAGSPDMFDMSKLVKSLAEPQPRMSHTPDSFLGPAAASLVDLDALIPANPQANLNPFLAGGGPSTIVNPFDAEPVRHTLGQMGSAMTRPSLPYSASLPLAGSQQPASLPSSFSHPDQSGLELPQPLLPFSTGAALASQPALNNQNPFL
ncbi:epsin-3 isoform X2 [Syngnathus scovelli]|uniref:epsin-3 isoform X2 n=1 Tax=Syngnathus scovelli TaxID=161590 RepID=UPI00210F993D|nr:epsin-3 isoform X2 [Syngnathus scovelli]